jgi:signal transduction histidine kinase
MGPPPAKPTGVAVRRRRFGSGAPAAIPSAVIDAETTYTCSLDSERWVRLSPRWEAALGWNASSATEDVIHLLESEDAAFVTRHLESRAQGANETGLARPPSPALWLRWKLVRRGRRLYALGRNLDRERRARRDQQELQRKLEHAQRHASLGLLASSIAHDFNNVLTSVLGSASLALVELSEHTPLHPVHRELESIVEAAEFASSLCHQLLAYAGKGSTGARELHLSELVRSMSRLLALSAGKRVDLSFALSEAISPIVADPVQLGQVLMNLIANGRDAMGELHGAIEVRTGQRWYDAEELAHGHVGPAHAAGEYVFVCVRDTGAGMLPGALQHSFDPFFSTKGEGRGLGLAATLGIVTSHEGAISVESQPGRGTTFQVLFPVAVAQSSTLKADVPRRG